MSGRPSARILSVAALTAAILGIAGCYGQTDFATQIGHNAATLNAHGSANSGPVEPYFEFWKTATPNTRIQTPVQIVPGGVSGPVSARATNLTDGTDYSYRFCGTDSSTHGSPVCAQTQTFVTGLSSVQATGDTTQPGADFDFARISVNVVAAPPGGTPRGHVSYRLRDHRSIWGPGGTFWDFGSQTEDNINCVRIQGNVAVIGFRQVPPFPSNISFRNDQWVFIVDGGLSDSGKDSFAGTIYVGDSGPAANDCSFQPSTDGPGTLSHGDAAVSEVQPVSPN
jgi:hypothetical protein